MNQTNKLTAAMCLALSGSLMFSCADSKHKKNNPVTPAGAPVEEKVAEPAAELKFATIAQDSSLTVSISIPNSENKLETLYKTNARRVVEPGTETYDYFLSGKGEVKQVALLRNDVAQLAIAYVVNTEETYAAIGEAALKGFDLDSLYDAVYLFDLGSEEGTVGSFKAEMTSVDLFVTAEELGLTTEELTEMVREAVLAATEKTTVAQIIEAITLEVRPEETEAETGKGKDTEIGATVAIGATEVKEEKPAIGATEVVEEDKGSGKKAPVPTPIVTVPAQK